MSTVSKKGIDSQQIQQAEQILYDYFLECVKKNSPEQVIEEFRDLFIQAKGCKDINVYLALEKIVKSVKSKEATEQFNFFLNRCCYILINRWQMHPQSELLIARLVAVFDYLGANINGYPTTSNILRRLILNFIKNEQFLKLKRLVKAIDTPKNSNAIDTNSPVGNLISRYPYLYDRCLLSDRCTQEDRTTILRIKAQKERAFELDLSKYATYQVRLARIAPASEMSTVIRQVQNPTLLSDRELNRALHHYVSPVVGDRTYKDLSCSFLAHSAHTPTFRAFKDDLYEYILTSLDSKYVKSQFNKKLFHYLQNTLPEFDRQKPNEFLIMRTSSQLFNFLVVESSHQLEHYIFVDLITNLGVTRTVGLLLKVVLLCNKVKPYLEKRVSILFNHYESFAQDGVPWLVKSLESLQVAFSLHFGKIDISCFKQLQLH